MPVAHTAQRVTDSMKPVPLCRSAYYCASSSTKLFHITAGSSDSLESGRFAWNISKEPAIRRLSPVWSRIHQWHCPLRRHRLANFFPNDFSPGRVRVKFSLGVRVSGMIRVRVDVGVRVRVSNLLGSV